MLKAMSINHIFLAPAGGKFATGNDTSVTQAAADLAAAKKAKQQGN